MDSSPETSPIETAAAALRGIWAAMLARFGLFGVEPDFQVVTSNWVGGILRRLEELLVRCQAGQAAAGDGAGCGGSGAENAQQTSGSHAAQIRVAGADGHARDGCMAGSISERVADSAVSVEGARGEDVVGDRQAVRRETAQTSKTAPEIPEVSASIAAWRDLGGAKVVFFEKMVWGWA